MAFVKNVLCYVFRCSELLLSVFVLSNLQTRIIITLTATPPQLPPQAVLQAPSTQQPSRLKDVSLGDLRNKAKQYTAAIYAHAQPNAY